MKCVILMLLLFCDDAAETPIPLALIPVKEDLFLYSHLRV